MKFARQASPLTSQVWQTRKTLLDSLEVWVVGMKGRKKILGMYNFTQTDRGR